MIWPSFNTHYVSYSSLKEITGYISAMSMYINNEGTIQPYLIANLIAIPYSTLGVYIVYPDSRDIVLTVCVVVDVTV